MLSSTAIRCFADADAVASGALSSGPIGREIASSIEPSTPESGVRSSCPTEARNWPLASREAWRRAAPRRDDSSSRCAEMSTATKTAPPLPLIGAACVCSGGRWRR